MQRSKFSNRSKFTSFENTCFLPNPQNFELMRRKKILRMLRSVSGSNFRETYDDFVTLKKPLSVPPPPKFISERLENLAIPKRYVDFLKCSNEHCMPRFAVPFAALGADATPRILQLATPKFRPELKERDQRISWKAKNYVASARICELAKPKRPHPEFCCYAELPLRVPPAALQCNASSRLKSLAKAKERGQEYNQRVRDMRVFQVKPAAISARCSKRIQELAKPVHR